MEDRLSETEAKSREEVSNPTGLRHSRGPNCESVCVGMFIHMFLQASLTVCVSESLLLRLLFVCVCHGQRQRRRVNVVCCVCVCWPVFVGLIEASNHPGLMATQLWQSTSNTSREFSEWFSRKRDGGRGEQRYQKLLGRFFWLPQQFCKKCELCVHFILSLWCLYLCLCDALDHYHAPLTRFRMKLRNSEPRCDI